MTDTPELPSPERLAFLLARDLEDDDVPLWEVVWTINTMAPSASLAEKIKLARRAVRHLSDQYELWRGEWPHGPVAPLTETEASVMADDDACWHDPENATLLVWIHAIA